jgi:hypothetical protein
MMARLRLACPLVALVFVVAAFADDTKPDSDKAAKDKKQAADKLVTAGSLYGKVVEWDIPEKLLTLNVKLSVPDGIDQGAANAIQAKQAELARLQVSPPPRNPNEYQNRLNKVATLTREIQQNQAKLYKFKQVDQKFTLVVADNAAVRQMELPTKFDDKGFPVKLTAEEKRELKGNNPRLPGYKADFDAIKADDMVQVTLSRKRDASANTADKTKTEKKTDKVEEKDAPIRLDKNLQATVVVIGAEEAKK